MRRIDRSWFVYIFIILFLVFGIVSLWSKKNIPKGVLDFLFEGASQLITGKKMVKVSPLDSVFVKKENVVMDYKDKKEINKNIVGKVRSWNSQTNVLTIGVDTKQTDIEIDPVNTRVLVVKSQNYTNDNKLSTISNIVDSEEWKTAFCIDDDVSILIEPTTGMARVVFDTGVRACGFQGGLK